jgi:hypothetical protein
LANTLNKTITHYRQLADTSLFIMNICFAHLWTFYTIVLQFLHSSHFGHKPCIIHDGFLKHSCFLVWRMQITARISQVAGLSICRTHHNLLCRDKKNTEWPVIWWFTRQWVMWRYLAHVNSPLLLH